MSKKVLIVEDEIFVALEIEQIVEDAGFDVGAIYSLYVAAFCVFVAWNEGEGSDISRLLNGSVRVILIALFAAFVAAYTLSTLIGTQIKGVAGMGQDAESKERRWAEATAWSTPKAETFRVISSAPSGISFQSAPSRVIATT